ncbi:MAG TPA: TolC family protein [Planctomycetaceae bacterium]|nr:TolC family protein [Planctomycetaceae bacterium]
MSTPVPTPQVAASPQGNATLTLQELEQLALANNPTLAQAAADVERERALYVQDGLYPNPLLGYLRNDASRSGQPRTDGAFFSQEIVTAKKLQKAQAVESQHYASATWQQVAQRQRVLNDLYLRYFEVLGAQEAVRIAERLKSVADEGVTLAEDLYHGKQGSKPDVLQSRIHLNSVKITLREAQNRYTAAWRHLAVIVGCPELQPIPLEGRLQIEAPALTFEDSWAQLQDASPQLKSAQIELEAFKAELRLEQAQPIPNVTAQVVAQYDHTNQYTSVSTLLAAPVPIYNRNQGNIQRALADIREAQAEVERVRLVLRDALTDSFNRYQTTHYQVEQVEHQILPDARENLSLTTAGYKLGEYSFLEVLNARRTYAQAYLAYVESLTELRKVMVEIDGLQLVGGGLNPPELGKAIQAQGGGGRRQAILNQLRQDSSTKQTLPGTVQSMTP